MLAAWYERAGPAAEVLEVGEMADPEPGTGEVRVRLTFSGINPGDIKKRGDWVGYGMPYPRVIPHSDGAGVVDAVGEGVASGRIGERVWVYGAQSYRAFGTAAQLTVVPAEHAVTLPDGVSDEAGACLGIPGITGAHEHQRRDRDRDQGTDDEDRPDDVHCRTAATAGARPMARRPWPPLSARQRPAAPRWGRSGASCASRRGCRARSRRRGPALRAPRGMTGEG